MPSTHKPVVFITVIFCLLIAYSFLSNLFSFSWPRQHNFISDITDGEKPVVKRLSSLKKNLLVADSITGTPHVPDYLTYDGIVGYEPKGALANFITALKELKAGKRKKVRIAYFGDSMIEGDLISEDLRRMLQDSFGGTGVGFVPVTSVVSGFRQTVMHSYSTNWSDHSYMTRPLPANLFLSGHCFSSDSTSTVQYGVTTLPHLDQFAQAYVLYGKYNTPLQLLANNKPFTLPATAGFNKAQVASGCKVLRVKETNSCPLFGFCFEDSIGIYLDNYAFRGSTGIELGNFSTAFLQQVQAVHQYDLIIFQYGPNLFTPKIADFTWYEKPMLTVINKFKKGFETASLLVVSTADKAYRYNGQMETAVGVEPLLEAQHHVAQAGGVNLWNLYHAMGGYNAMLNWVEGDTALARKDYTHFTSKGARRIATMLFTAMMKTYEPTR